MGEGKSPDSNLRTLDGRQREKKESWVGNEMKFELEWEQLEPLLESGGCYALGFPSFSRPGKLRQTSGRLNSRGTVDGRRPITVGGGGAHILMG